MRNSIIFRNLTLNNLHFSEVWLMETIVLCQDYEIFQHSWACCCHRRTKNEPDKKEKTLDMDVLGNIGKRLIKQNNNNKKKNCYVRENASKEKYLCNITHQSSRIMAHGDKLVVSSQMTPHVALKEREGLEHHVLPSPCNPRCRSLLVEESGATTELLPPVQMSRDLQQLQAQPGEAGQRRELQTSADNSDRELAFPTL